MKEVIVIVAATLISFGLGARWHLDGAQIFLLWALAWITVRGMIAALLPIIPRPYRRYFR